VCACTLTSAEDLVRRYTVAPVSTNFSCYFAGIIVTICTQDVTQMCSCRKYFE